MAAIDNLSSTKVKLAEYSGMNRGAQTPLYHQVADPNIVRDSRLAIPQAMRVIACKHSALQVELARQKEMVMHLIPYYNYTLYDVNIRLLTF